MRAEERPGDPAPTTAGTLASPRFAALRSRNFTTIWLATMVSNAGAQMQIVAKSWLIVQRTDSALALAIFGLFYAIPVILLLPIGGVIADRVDRITLLKGTQTLQVIQPFVLAALFASGHAPLWVLYADSVLVAVFSAFNTPAQQALLPALVPPGALLSAISLQNAVWTGAQLVGSALGGTLLVAVGAVWLFVINGVTTLAVLAALFRLRGIPGAEPIQRTATGRRVGSIRYVWEQASLRAIFAFTMLSTLLGGANQVLLPFFGRDIWHVGARGYGLLLAASGVGTLVGTFALAAYGDIPHKVPMIGGASTVWCIALVGFANAPWYGYGMIALVVVGITGAVSGALLMTLLQLIVPGEMRGRVLALRAMIVSGLGNIGGLIAGVVAGHVGVVAVVMWGAIAVCAVVPLLIRQMTQIAWPIK